MARAVSGIVSKKRHKKYLKRAKGYFGSKHRLFKTAKEQVWHSDQYAYRDRRQNKRNFRKLWIVRINAECRVNNISYSKFISGLNKAGIIINRKMLSEMAIEDKEAFANIVKIAKDALEGKMPKEAKVTSKKEETKKEEKKEEVKAEKKAPAKKVEKKETTKKAEPKKEAKKTETKKVEKKPAAKKETTKKETAKKTTKKTK